MRAAAIRDGRIVVEERPDPEPRDGEVLIRVKAAGINGADLGQRAGRYPPPPGVTDVPGLECAGEGPQGERLMALLGGGGQAELAVADRRHVLPVPDDLGWNEAGGFMEAFATAHDALFAQAGLAAGERVLVNGAAGGVGVAAVQVAVAAGAEVAANARHHHDELRALGAGTEIGDGYDVIIELVGGENLSTNVQRLATEGRIVVLGVGAGARVEFDFGQLAMRRGRIFAPRLRPRTADERAAVIRALGEFMRGRRFHVPVDETFPLERTQDAYERFGAGGKFGKVVVGP